MIGRTVGDRKVLKRLFSQTWTHPSVGEELFQFAGLKRVDPGEDIRQIFFRVDLVPFGRGNEGHEHCNRPSAIIGPREQEIFSSENKAFDRLLAQVVMCALSRYTGSVGTKSHPATLAPAGSTQGESGGDK